ncbi:MAG: hypothetical protein WCI11_06785 [Candidatus Methylumidiphilus sp.]
MVRLVIKQRAGVSEKRKPHARPHRPGMVHGKSLPDDSLEHAGMDADPSAQMAGGWPRYPIPFTSPTDAANNEMHGPWSPELFKGVDQQTSKVPGQPASQTADVISPATAPIIPATQAKPKDSTSESSKKEDGSAKSAKGIVAADKVGKTAEEDKKKDKGKDNASAKEESPEAKGKGKQGKEAGEGQGKLAKVAAQGSTDSTDTLELDGGEVDAEAEEADPEVSVESVRLDIPLDISVQPVAAQWQAPATLPADAFPARTDAQGGPSTNETKGKPPAENKKGGGSANPQPTAKGGVTMEGARDRAIQTYQELSSQARRKQQSLLGEANSIANYMAQGYGITAGEITRQHEEGIGELDVHADQACAQVESIGFNAESSLEGAYRQAVESLQAAAGSAWGAINANDKKTSTLITSNVATLESTQNTKFTAETGKTTEALDNAVKALQEWSDNRAKVYPISEAKSPLDGAKHERYQPRVVVMATKRIDEIKKHTDELVKNWTTTNTTTLCNVTCSYRSGLDENRKKTFDAGRNAVGNALRSAKKSLSDQKRETLRTLRKLRSSTLSQIRNNQRNTRSRLTSQARATLNNVRRGAQSAVGAVQSSTRSALPGYWRSLQSLEQNLRMAGTGGGAAAIAKVAQTAPQGVQRILENTTTSSHDRLIANRERLESDNARQKSSVADSRQAQIQASETVISKSVSDANQQMVERVMGLTASADELAKSVSEAAQNSIKAPDQLFKESLEKSQSQAADSLDGMFTGKPAKKEGKQDGKDKKEGGADPCASCAKDAAPGAGGGASADAGAQAPGAGGPRGITDQRKKEVEDLNKCLQPGELFKPQLDGMGSQVAGDLTKRGRSVEKAFSDGFLGSVNEGKVTAALRGTTAAQGKALDLKDYPAAINTGTPLTTELQVKLGPDSKDYKAAILYLQGKTVEGAKAELDASQNWYNDQEDRIEATMRALTPAQAAELSGSDPVLAKRIHDALDGTDQKVFDALAKGDAATADAYRMRDKIDEARKEGKTDAVHAAEIEFTSLRGETDDQGNALADMDEKQRKQAEDAHRAAVAKALGKMVVEEDPANAVDTGKMTKEQQQTLYEQKALDYITRDVVIDAETGTELKGVKPSEYGCTYTNKMEGANRDLAKAILLHGNNSVEAGAARLGIEIQRKDDDPKAINVDKAVFDERFSSDDPNKNPKASQEEKKAYNESKSIRDAREKRAKILLLAAQKYAGAEEPSKGYKPDTDKPLDDPRVVGARDLLTQRLAAQFGDDKKGAQLVAGLLKDERPSAETASLAMEHAMYSHWGTNEELMFHFTERMSRDEINAMRDKFKDRNGKSLDAELGLHGKGPFFSELSGDERLRMERAMLGVPRTEQEKIEAAAFAIQQQRRETGFLGKSLASGSQAEQALDETERILYQSAGVKASDFNEEGILQKGKGFFDPKTGEYKGTDRDKFVAATTTAQLAVENYTAVIDSYADIATTGIAIAGAIVAAALTVATGGAAAPLIAAAVVAGLASMGANYAIKGGRYGWEQAAVDLGMTAVQAITAGVGAQLGAGAQVASKGAQAASQASRMVTSLARLFTGNPVIDQIIVGAITGGIGSLGNTALQEQTWEHGADQAVGNLLKGLIKGAMSGAATAAVTQAIEHAGGLGEKLQQLSAEGSGRTILRNMALRGLGRGAIAGLSGMAGRGTEILFEKRMGDFHGNAEEAFGEIGKAGLHSAVQGFGEGAAEAVGQRFHNENLRRAASAVVTEREQLGLEALAPKELQEAASDLLFLNTHGRQRDGLGEALNLEHVATHGGIQPTLAVAHPEPVVIDSMRAELMRHVSPDLHGEFANVPIRVLPEAEYHALTKSESGPVVTLIHDGKPTVVIREGTPISRLSDEGPHLVQARDTHTKARVARLDEAVLAHWDSLDINTQVDLYRNKIELEIDAHERIARSLEEQTPRTKEERAFQAAERERTEGTLRNLRARLEEVGSLGASKLAAMEAGELKRPQYLDQPARLFSKDTPTGKARSTSAEINEHITETIGEIERSIKPKPGGEADTGQHALPHEPPIGHPEGDSQGRLFERTPEQIADIVNRRERGNTFNTEQEPLHAHNEVRLQATEGKGQPRVDFYEPGATIGSRKHTQLAEISEAAAIGHINELVEKYHEGARIAEVPSNERVLAEGRARLGEEGERLHGMPVLVVPEQHAPVPRAVLEIAERAGVIIRDPEGRVYDLQHPDGHDGAVRASARDPEQHADAMREELLRHVPPEQREQFADVNIHVLREAEYRALTHSESGPVVTLISKGEPIVVIREGTDIRRLADEGPHLVQAREAHTRDRVARLDESVLAHWDKLDIDTQINLYRNKIELEIDAHNRIIRSLDESSARGGADPVRMAAERGRAEGTLRNLNARLEEVSAISPRQRTAIESGKQPRPQYLEQPARLFSKDTPQGRAPPVANEPTEAVEAGKKGGHAETEGKKTVGEGKYPGQPELRGPRMDVDPESVAGLRQRHEARVEDVRRGYLDPGSRPPTTEGDVPKPGWPPSHSDTESAYAAHDALVREHGGPREAGIVRNADTGQSILEVEPPSAKPPSHIQEAEAESKLPSGAHSETDRPPPSGEANRSAKTALPTLESSSAAPETQSATQEKQGQTTKPIEPAIETAKNQEMPLHDAGQQQESPLQGLSRSKQELENSKKILIEANESQVHFYDQKNSDWEQIIRFLERNPEFKAALSQLPDKNPEELNTVKKGTDDKKTSDLLNRDNESHVKFVREFAEKMANRTRQGDPKREKQFPIEEALSKFELSLRNEKANGPRREQEVNQAQERVAAAEAKIAHYEELITKLRLFPAKWEQQERMSERLPAPAHSEGWSYEGPKQLPDQTKGTPANWESQVNGYRAELKLANEMAEGTRRTPEGGQSEPEHVVYWGHRANEHGTDIISVTKDGEVIFADAKFDGDGKVEHIPSQTKPDSWVNKPQEFLSKATEKIKVADLPENIKKTALKNLEKKNYTILFYSYGPGFTHTGQDQATYRKGVKKL